MEAITGLHFLVIPKIPTTFNHQDRNTKYQAIRVKHNRLIALLIILIFLIFHHTSLHFITNGKLIPDHCPVRDRTAMPLLIKLCNPKVKSSLGNDPFFVTFLKLELTASKTTRNNPQILGFLSSIL